MSHEVTQTSTKYIESDDNYSLKFDFVLVFKMVDIGDKVYKQSPEAKFYIQRMLDSGLSLFTYLSVQGDELITLIHCPDDKVREFADLIDFPLRLDPDVLRETLLAGNPQYKIARIDITNDPSITPYSPYEYIYCKYESTFPQALYYKYDGKIFPKLIKLKIIYDILRGPTRKRGCDMPISSLIHKKKVTGFYPLHSPAAAMNLLEKQLNWRTAVWKQDFEEIRMYYGEKIALYNLFLGHYSGYLVVPAVIGFAFQLVVWGTVNFSHPVLPFFGVIVTVGAIVMLEDWKRKQARTALMWGMSSFEDRENDRPEFAGIEMKSYIDGSDILYFPPADFRLRIQYSFAIILSMIALVIGVVAGIYTLRFSLQSSLASVASLIASVLNTVQIIVFNIIYQSLVQRLTNLENHRTDTSYEDSLIIKLFLFQFVNSYSSFFFLAFIAQNLSRPDGVSSSFKGQCGATTCMLPLSINLAIIFGSRLVVTNTLSIVVPWILQKLKLRNETKGVEEKTLTPAEKDYMLLPYDSMMENINNYADTAVQFGFMCLFIVALPIGCFFSMVNSYVKVRIDSYKLTHFYQRPIPAGAQDIGTWQDIFNLISIASVVTNGALICFTMDVLYLRGWTEAGRLWIFIGFQWTLVTLQLVLQYIIPDVPEEVQIQLARTAFINEKVILHVPDEEYDEFEVEEPEEVRVAEGTKESAPLAAPQAVCCRPLKGKKSRKIKNPDAIPEVPENTYPHVKGSGWPEMMARQKIGGVNPML